VIDISIGGVGFVLRHVRSDGFDRQIVCQDCHVLIWTENYHVQCSYLRIQVEVQMLFYTIFHRYYPINCSPS